MSLFHSRILVSPNISPIRPIFCTLHSNKSSILGSLHKSRDNEKTTPRQRIRCLIYALNYLIPDPLMPVRCDPCGSTPDYIHRIPQPYPPTQQSGAAIFVVSALFISRTIYLIPPNLSPVNFSSRIHPKISTPSETLTSRKHYRLMHSRLRHPFPIRSHTDPPRLTPPCLPYPSLPPTSQR